MKTIEGSTTMKKIISGYDYDDVLSYDLIAIVVNCATALNSIPSSAIWTTSLVFYEGWQFGNDGKAYWRAE